jgi:hypothetical protein
LSLLSINTGDLPLLRFTFEHVYGAQEKNDLGLVKLRLDTNNIHERDALENGWLIHCGEWYQCRSVRINLKKFVVKNKFPNHIKVERISNTDLHHSRNNIRNIYDHYVRIKNYKDHYAIFDDHDRASWLLVYDCNLPIAFTKLIHYQGGLESQYNAWNYHKPGLFIGKNLVHYEAAVALENHLDYLYIGAGYEKGCLYKAEYNGFEWWTGTEWSEDKIKYRELCVRDSTINSLEDLSKLFNDFK